ncbi:hypothetical protein MUY35_11785 [Aliiroseovarius sp. S1339]|uniref:hypothetical protein n=1 Tax=Aliiroseovarius sp. S1339 TaxID=2936990 RepID=UPI0020C00C90|nr:hypothetical protein [Aliiroseovarius sp. S1339]MCK8464532.1 hypothetical protein [Aliiroseovarius sp. S1339]
MDRQLKNSRAGALRIGAAIGILIGLTGCLGGDGKFGPKLSDSAIFSNERATPRADLVRAKSVMGGLVTIAAPKGFCIDTSAHQDTSSGAFIPIGACAALTKDAGDPKPAKPAFLTATVLPMPVQAAALPNNPDARMREARAFVQSDKGRAALSRAGNAGTVTLMDMKSASNVLFVRVRDTSDGLPFALSNTTWRAFFELNGQLVTASATAFADQPFGQGKGYELLKDFVAAIRKASPKV